MKQFSKEEIRILRANPYTFEVTGKTIRFTKEFKEEFLKKLNEGISPIEIVESLGYDIEILGVNRPRGIAGHIKEEYALYKSFHNGRIDETRAAEANLSNVDDNSPLMLQIAKLNTRVKYLEQQVEFLKKIQKGTK